jgi:hypothetical protein
MPGCIPLTASNSKYTSIRFGSITSRHMSCERNKLLCRVVTGNIRLWRKYYEVNQTQRFVLDKNENPEYWKVSIHGLDVWRLSAVDIMHGAYLILLLGLRRYVCRHLFGSYSVQIPPCYQPGSCSVASSCVAFLSRKSCSIHNIL